MLSKLGAMGIFFSLPVIMGAVFYFGKVSGCKEVSIKFLSYYENSLYISLKQQNKLNVFSDEVCK